MLLDQDGDVTEYSTSDVLEVTPTQKRLIFEEVEKDELDRVMEVLIPKVRKYAKQAEKKFKEKYQAKFYSM